MAIALAVVRKLMKLKTGLYAKILRHCRTCTPSIHQYHIHGCAPVFGVRLSRRQQRSLDASCITLTLVKVFAVSSHSTQYMLHKWGIVPLDLSPEAS